MRSKRLMVAMVVLAVFGALAGIAYRIYLNPVRDTAIDLVPPDAVIYASVFLSPSTHQKQALEALLKHFPTARTPDLAKSELERLLDPALTPAGIDFTHDVEPWIGRQVAFFAQTVGPNPSGALLISTRDPGSSMAALEKVIDAQHGSSRHLSYEGIDYVAARNLAAGVIGSFAVVANDEDAFRAVVRASAGSSLGDSAAYGRATSALPKDRVATFYGDPSRVPLPTIVTSGLPQVAGGVFLRSDSIVLDVEVPRSEVSPAAAAALRVAASTLLPPQIDRLADQLLDGGVATDGDLAAAALGDLGPDYRIRGVLDHDALATVADDRENLPDPARAFLDHLSYVALGTRTDHETLFARIVIGVR